MTISDINAKISFLTKTNTTSFAAADRLIAVNNAYDRVVSLILQADGRWLWGDSNYSSLPTGLQTLVADQTTYTFDATQLNVQRVEVKNNLGIWQELEPIALEDIEGAQQEFHKTSGMPAYYEKRENFLILYPAPSATYVTLTSGLRVTFQRVPDYFTSGQVTTGTKTPGINPLYHDLLALWPAYDYAVGNGLKNASQLRQEIDVREKALTADYAHRGQDEHRAMRMKPILFT